MALLRGYKRTWTTRHWACNLPPEGLWRTFPSALAFMLLQPPFRPDLGA
jgi:hypothetical protein